jgi:hypothetical protein
MSFGSADEKANAQEQAGMQDYEIPITEEDGDKVLRLRSKGETLVKVTRNNEGVYCLHFNNQVKQESETKAKEANLNISPRHKKKKSDDMSSKINGGTMEIISFLSTQEIKVNGGENYCESHGLSLVQFVDLLKKLEELSAEDNDTTFSNQIAGAFGNINFQRNLKISATESIKLFWQVFAAYAKLSSSDGKNRLCGKRDIINQAMNSIRNLTRIKENYGLAYEDFASLLWVLSNAEERQSVIKLLELNLKQFESSDKKESDVAEHTQNPLDALSFNLEILKKIISDSSVDQNKKFDFLEAGIPENLRTTKPVSKCTQFSNSLYRVMSCFFPFTRKSSNGKSLGQLQDEACCLYQEFAGQQATAKPQSRFSGCSIQ